MRQANGEKRYEEKEREKRNVSKYRKKDGRPKTKKNTYVLCLRIFRMLRITKFVYMHKLIDFYNTIFFLCVNSHFVE